VAEASVRLRSWRAQDAPALAAAWNDPTIAAASQPPDDRSLDAAARWIEGCAVREERLLAIDRVVSVDGACVGEVGLSSMDPARKAAVVGWWIGIGHRGNGFATAAVRELIGVAFDEFDIRTLVAEIGIENAGSVRVAERTGFELLRQGSEDRPHAYVHRHHCVTSTRFSSS